MLSPLSLQCCLQLLAVWSFRYKSSVTWASNDAWAISCLFFQNDEFCGSLGLKPFLFRCRCLELKPFCFGAGAWVYIHLLLVQTQTNRNIAGIFSPTILLRPSRSRKMRFWAYERELFTRILNIVPRRQPGQCARRSPFIICSFIFQKRFMICTRFLHDYCI